MILHVLFKILNILLHLKKCSCFITFKKYIFKIFQDFSCSFQDLEWCFIIFCLKNIHVLSMIFIKFSRFFKIIHVLWKILNDFLLFVFYSWYLILSDPFWSYLIFSDPIWSYLIQFDPIQCISSKFLSKPWILKFKKVVCRTAPESIAVKKSDISTYVLW